MGSAQKLRVGMVENNIGLGQLTRETALRQTSMAAELAKSEQPDLIVFPETAIKTPPPMLQLEGESELHAPSTRYHPLNMTRIGQSHEFSVQSGYQTPVIFGCTAIDPDRKGPVPGRPALFNAAFMLDAKGNVLGTALKNRLLIIWRVHSGL